MWYWLWRLVLVLALMGLLVFFPTNVDVHSAEVSRDDMRLRLFLGTCNPTWVYKRAVDVGHRVEVAVFASPNRLLGGPDCAQLDIVALPEPLAGRDVFDRSSRRLVPVELSSQRRPFDRERFSLVDYEAALAAMVACVEARDPLIDAAIVDSLDWPTFEWHKPRDERGNMSAPVVSECRSEHLEPLRG